MSLDCSHIVSCFRAFQVKHVHKNDLKSKSENTAIDRFFLHELDDQFKGVKNQLMSHFKTSKHPYVCQVCYCFCCTSADHLAFLTDHPKVQRQKTQRKTTNEKQWRSEDFMADTQLLPGYIP